MLGPLRSSRASSLGQAGVFLFVCCLITSTLGSNRLFQQVPQNNTLTNNNKKSATNQTIPVYDPNGSAKDDSNGEQSRILVLSIGGFVVILVLVALVYFALKGCKDIDPNARNPESAKDGSQEMSTNLPRPACPPVPNSAVFAQHSEVIQNIRNHILGEPDLGANSQPAPPQTQAVPVASKKAKKLRKIPSMVIMELRNNREAARTAAGAAHVPGSITKYQVPLSCLDLVTQIEFVDIPEVPREAPVHVKLDTSGQ